MSAPAPARDRTPWSSALGAAEENKRTIRRDQAWRSSLLQDNEPALSAPTPSTRSDIQLPCCNGCAEPTRPAFHQLPAPTGSRIGRPRTQTPAALVTMLSHGRGPDDSIERDRLVRASVDADRRRVSRPDLDSGWYAPPRHQCMMVENSTRPSRTGIGPPDVRGGGDGEKWPSAQAAGQAPRVRSAGSAAGEHEGGSEPGVGTARRSRRRQADPRSGKAWRTGARRSAGHVRSWGVGRGAGAAHIRGAEPAGRASSRSSRVAARQDRFRRSPPGDAPPLLRDAAKGLEQHDAGQAREAHLEALGAAIFAGPLNDSDCGTRPRSPRLRRRGPWPPRLIDVLLDGLATRFTRGFRRGRATAEASLAGVPAGSRTQ
jgi:hypothetical protein